MEQTGRFQHFIRNTWWRNQMETFSALLAICAGKSPIPGEFPTKRPVTWGFDVLFDLRPNKRLNKQWWGWWFQTQSCPLWRRRDEICIDRVYWTNITHLTPEETKWLYCVMLSLVGDR